MNSSIILATARAIKQPSPMLCTTLRRFRGTHGVSTTKASQSSPISGSHLGSLSKIYRGIGHRTTGRSASEATQAATHIFTSTTCDNPAHFNGRSRKHEHDRNTQSCQDSVELVLCLCDSSVLVMFTFYWYLNVVCTRFSFNNLTSLESLCEPRA